MLVLFSGWVFQHRHPPLLLVPVLVPQPPVCSTGGCVLTLFSMPLHVRSGSVSVRISGGRELFPCG